MAQVKWPALSGLSFQNAAETISRIMSHKIQVLQSGYLAHHRKCRVKSELFLPEAEADRVTKIMLGQRRNSSSLWGSPASSFCTKTLLGGLYFSVNSDRNSISQPQTECGYGEFTQTPTCGLSTASVCLQEPQEGEGSE